MSAKTKKSEAPARQALLVLGMHRSGTSALSGVLASLGAHTPRTLMPVTADNERGYFESSALADFHDELLQSAGGRWSDWDAFNPAWLASGQSQAFGRRLQELLQQEFGDAPLFLVKDPRICRFVPFWLRTLQAMQVTPKVVIPLRHPMEVARSLGARDAFGLNRSLLIWLRHVLEAEFATRGLDRSMVRYVDLLDDWRGLSQRLSTQLDVAWPRWSGAVELEIDQFLSGQLRHQRLDEIGTVANAQITQWVGDAYTALEAMTTGSATAADMQPRLDAIRADFDERSAAFAAVAMEHQQAATEEVRHIRQQVDAAQGHAQALAAQVEALNGAVAERQQRLDEAQARIEEVQHAYNELERSKHEEMAHSTRLQAWLDEARAQRDAFDHDLAQARQAGTQEAAHLQAELERAQAHAAALQQAVERSQQQFQDLQQQAGQVQRVQQAELEQQAARIAQLEAEGQQARNERDEQAARVPELEQACQALQSQLDERSAQADALAEESRALEALCESQRRVVAEHDAQHAAQRDEIASLKASIVNQLAIISSRDAALAKLQDEIAALKRAADLRTTELGILVNQCRDQLKGAVSEDVAAATNAAAPANSVQDALLDVAGLARALDEERQQLYWRKVALEQQVAHHAGELVELRAQLAALHGSLSWRLTSPLRRMARPFRGGHAGAKPSLQDDAQLIRLSGWFDPRWYQGHYPDVAESGVDPVEHYLQTGAGEGRDPGPEFSTRHYVDSYADVAASGMNPLVHFIRYGFAEMREPAPGANVAAAPNADETTSHPT